jgi:excisionase family DNA binding protein
MLQMETYMPHSLLTLEEAARRLNVSVSTVRRMIKDRELIATKLRGDWRVDPVDLEAFIQQGKSKPKET